MFIFQKIKKTTTKNVWRNTYALLCVFGTPNYHSIWIFTLINGNFCPSFYQNFTRTITKWPPHLQQLALEFYYTVWEVISNYSSIWSQVSTALMLLYDHKNLKAWWVIISFVVSTNQILENTLKKKVLVYEVSDTSSK